MLSQNLRDKEDVTDSEGILKTITTVDFLRNLLKDQQEC